MREKLNEHLGFVKEILKAGFGPALGELEHLR